MNGMCLPIERKLWQAKDLYSMKHMGKGKTFSQRVSRETQCSREGDSPLISSSSKVVLLSVDSLTWDPSPFLVMILRPEKHSMWMKTCTARMFTQWIEVIGMIYGTIWIRALKLFFTCRIQKPSFKITIHRTVHRKQGEACSQLDWVKI